MKPYTVILLYPSSACDGGVQTYLAHVQAPNPEFAILECRELAEADNHGNVSAGDFEPLFVFEGHIDPEWSGMP